MVIRPAKVTKAMKHLTMRLRALVGLRVDVRAAPSSKVRCPDRRKMPRCGSAAASGLVVPLPPATDTPTGASRGREAAADETADRGQGGTSRAREALKVSDAAEARDGQDGLATGDAGAHGPALEHPRHGGALLPRFLAADFVLVPKARTLLSAEAEYRSY